MHNSPKTLHQKANIFYKPQTSRFATKIKSRILKKIFKKHGISAQPIIIFKTLSNTMM